MSDLKAARTKAKTSLTKKVNKVLSLLDSRDNIERVRQARRARDIVQWTMWSTQGLPCYPDGISQCWGFRTVSERNHCEDWRDADRDWCVPKASPSIPSGFIFQSRIRSWFTGEFIISKTSTFEDWDEVTRRTTKDRWIEVTRTGIEDLWNCVYVPLNSTLQNQTSIWKLESGLFSSPIINYSLLIINFLAFYRQF